MTDARHLVKRCSICDDWIPSHQFADHLTNCSQGTAWDSVQDYLSENGPTSNLILTERGFTVADEDSDQVGVFRPHDLGARGHATRTVYLHGQSPELVIRVWVSSNESKFGAISRSSITRRIGKSYDEEWKAAWRRVADDVGIESHQQAPIDAGADPVKSCPKCGEEVRSRKFVRHIQNCK